MAARRIHLDVETYRTRNQAVIERLTKEAIEAIPAQNVAKKGNCTSDIEAVKLLTQVKQENNDD